MTNLVKQCNISYFFIKIFIIIEDISVDNMKKDISNSLIRMLNIKLNHSTLLYKEC